MEFKVCTDKYLSILYLETEYQLHCIFCVSGRVYIAPKTLRKRKEIVDISEDRPVDPNFEATGVELHKDSKFYQSWQNFKVKLLNFSFIFPTKFY